jgi:fatty acid amide hydrolase 2
MGFWTQVIIFIHAFIDKLAELIIPLFLGPRGRCPNVEKNSFITKSAVEVSEKIRNRELTSYQVVSAYIDRIIQINRSINAVIDGPFLEALDEARLVDERIENGEVTPEEFEKKPFLGVPFTVKDSTEVAGKLHTLGIMARQNVKGKVDSETVRRMKQAGAILICKTNVPEICMW